MICSCRSGIAGQLARGLKTCNAMFWSSSLATGPPTSFVLFWRKGELGCSELVRHHFYKLDLKTTQL